MSSVKMESIEFAKRHFNGSNVDDEEYLEDEEDDLNMEWKEDDNEDDEDNISRAYDESEQSLNYNDHDRAFSNIPSS